MTGFYLLIAFLSILLQLLGINAENLLNFNGCDFFVFSCDVPFLTSCHLDFSLNSVIMNGLAGTLPCPIPVITTQIRSNILHTLFGQNGAQTRVTNRVIAQGVPSYDGNYGYQLLENQGVMPKSSNWYHTLGSVSCN